jgi:hypothetical protein
MTDYVLHVGPHKTGTKYLQSRLAFLRHRLAGQGAVYPDVWQTAGAESGHPGLVEQVQSGNLDVITDMVARFGHDHERLVVLSSEEFTSFDESQLLALRDVLRPGSIRIIYYIRRWSELLPSLWQEFVKHGGDIPLVNFLIAHISNTARSTALNFGIVVDRYIKAFGRESVRLVSYSDLTDAGVDLMRHFGEICLAQHVGALDYGGLENLPKRPNASLSFIDAEMIRVLNALHRRHAGQHGSALREWYLHRTGEADVASAKAALSVHAGMIRLQDTLPPFEQLHRELIVRYGDLLTSPAERLFAPREAVVSHVREDYLRDYFLVSRLIAIYQRFTGSVGA